MPNGRHFTDPRYEELLESVKQLLSIIRRHTLISHLAHRTTTVAGYFLCMRKLLRWMDSEGSGRFADLDAAALLRFRVLVAQAKNNAGTTFCATTIQQYLNLFVYLYHFRAELDDALSFNPSALQTVHQSRSGIHHGPYTPDVVSAPLIRGAIEFLTSSAFDILWAREIYATAQRCRRSEADCSTAISYLVGRA